MTEQDEAKRAVARAALAHIQALLGSASVIGIGTGSTADQFVDVLAAYAAAHPGSIAATVASSERTAARLRAQGLRVIDLNEVDSLPVYVDGADEIDPSLAMIKGGGGALTREKIVAAVAQRFVCIADASKRVEVLGRFALPVEVIPMASAYIARQLRALGGAPRLREHYLTDNGNIILDVHGLRITDPRALEAQINQWPGVVTVGLFAARAADLLLLGTRDQVCQFERA